MQVLAVFECCHAAILGAGLFALCVYGLLELPLVPVLKHFFKSFLAVRWVVRVLIVFSQGDVCRYLIREVSQDIINRISPIIDPGIDPSLVAVLFLALYGDNGACAVWTAFSGTFGLPGRNWLILQWKAAMRAE